MAIIATSNDHGPHWYTLAGETRHGATLREARKERLLPSVTNVLDIIYRPELDEIRRDAAIRFGKMVHSACENYVLGKPWDQETSPWVAEYARWFTNTVRHIDLVEQVVVNPNRGYAGRLDLAAQTIHGPAVIDIKSQSIQGRSVKWYKTWGMQLAAYSMCRGIRAQIGISVVLNSKAPDPVQVKVWDNLEKYYDQFRYCLELWKFDKSYDPTSDVDGDKP